MRHVASRQVAIRNTDRDTVLDIVHHAESEGQRVPLDGAEFTPDGDIWRHGERFSVTANGFSKICNKLKVPTRFAEYFHKVDAQRWADMMSRLVSERHGDGLIMACDGTRVEGLVSSSYAHLTNAQVARRLFQEADFDRVSSFALDGLKMRLSVTSTKDAFEALPGDPIFPGANFYNSEDGGTSFLGEGFEEREICTNGTRIKLFGRSNRAIHRGSVLTHGRITEIFNEAIEASRATHEKIKLAAETTLNNDKWSRITKAAESELGKEYPERIKSAAIDEKIQRSGANPLTTVYDVWNGVTALGRKSESFMDTMKLERFAYDFVLN